MQPNQEAVKRQSGIILSNWINLVGVFLFVYIYAVAAALHSHLQYNIFQAFLAAGIGVCLYGLIFGIGFLLSLLILDSVLVLSVKPEKTKYMLITQWLLICTPLMYWAIKYNQPILVVGITAFGVSQFVRSKKIARLPAS